MNKILVVGSINLDMVLRVEKLSRPGETIVAKEILKNGGGKGANQAVAASRLGSCVSMISAVGNDDNGRIMLDILRNDGINISGVEILETETGLAVIQVDETAENSIVVVSGANARIDEKIVEKNKKLFDDVDIVILQNEIPMETVKYTLNVAKSKGKITVLNNAPAKKLDDEVLKNIDFLVVNEVELNESGEIFSLFEKGVGNIILTLGKKGSKWIRREEEIFVPALKVKAIDTTAAGDAFIGAFFTKYVGDIREALEFATKVSSIVVQKEGAQSSLPYIENIL